MLDSLALLGSGPAEAAAASLNAGAFLPLVVLLIALLKAIQSAGREDTNRRCAASALTVLATLTVVQVLKLIAASGRPLAPPLAAAVLGGIVVLALMVSALLGGLGLLQRLRSDPPQRGLQLGVWGLVLSVGVLGLSSQGIRASIQDSQAGPPPAVDVSLQATEKLEPLVYDWGPPTTSVDQQPSAPVRSGPLPVVQASATTTAYGPDDHVFDDLNFVFTPSGPEWSETDVSHLNKDITISFLRSRPQVMFTITAERLGEFFDTPKLAEIARERIYSASTECRMEPAEPMTLGGVEGVTFKTRATANGVANAYRHWVGMHRGFAYQLIAFGPDWQASSVWKEHRRMIAGFRLIDPDAVCEDGEVEKAAPFESDEFAFRVTPPETGWSVFNTKDPNLPPTDYLAIAQGGDKGLMVIAAPLGDRPADLGLVCRALLQRMEMTPDDPQVTEIRRGPTASAPQQDAVEYAARRGVGPRLLSYRLRVLQQNGCAYLIAGWSSAGGVTAIEPIAELLDRVAVLPGPAKASLVDPVVRTRTAALLNELALLEYQQGERRNALARLERAVELDPTVPVFVENLVEVASQVEGPAAALRRLEPIAARTPPPEGMALLYARLLCESGRYDEGIAAFAQESQQTPLSDEDLFTMGSAAVNCERYDETLIAFDRALAQRGGPDLQRWRASLLSHSGRHDEAIDALRRLASDSPNETAILVTLAEAYAEADRNDEAIATGRQIVSAAPTDADAWSLLGRLQLAARDLEGARVSLEKALALTPHHSEATELLTYVSGLQGRGDNRRVRDPIEPVPTPAALAEALAEYGATPAVADESGVVNLLRLTGYDYRVGAPRRVTQRRRMRVANRSGAEAISSLSTTFNPLSERVFVNELVVRDEAGAEIARGSVDDYYVMDDTESGMDTYNQMLKIPVPGVRPGCTVDLTVTHESLSRSDGFGFESHYLSTDSPTVVSAVFVAGDVGAIAAQTSGVETLRPDARTVAWVASDLPRWVDESFQGDPRTFSPHVVIGDAGREWSRLGGEYLEDLRETLAPNAEAERVAATLCAGLTTPAERIDKLARHVQESITYTAKEFGVRGVVPHGVDEIRRTANGDCKDHALLLHHLLRSAGVESHLALVNASGEVETALPSLDQFDHMVVCVPRLPRRDGGVTAVGLIDPTQKSVDPLLGVPLGLANKQVLVLDPRGPRLAAAAALDESYGWVTCTRTIQIGGPGPLGAAPTEVDEVVRFGPHLSSVLRSSLDDATRDEQHAWVRSMVGEDSDVTVDSVEVGGVDDLAMPIEVRCRYRVGNAFHGVAGDPSRLVGSLPNHWASLYCTPDPVAERKTPFEFTTPVEFRLTTRLTPSPGYHVAPTGLGGLGESLATFSWRSEARPADGAGVEIAMVLRRPAGTFPAASYEAFVQSARRALQTTSRAITVQRLETARLAPPAAGVLR